MQLAELFKEHLGIRLDILEKTLADFELDGLVLGAGPERFYYQDDQDIPYRPYHHFSHYCPVQGTDHVLVLSPAKKPILFHYHPLDFWYDHVPLGDPFWYDCFEIRSFSTRESLWKALSEFKAHGYLGPENDRARELGFEQVPESLEHHLNWQRAYKSPYEVFCVERATEIAARGHTAAKASFLEGGSELDIHLAYLSAARVTDRELPYNGIVALNEKGAVLHYAQKRDSVRDGMVLLIDSGATYHGYASDITRTHTARGVPDEFKSMLKAMNEEQLSLCHSISAGATFGDLQHESHMAVGRVLLEHGILKGVDLEGVLEKNLTRIFYPHGISHLLGLFVHDVGSKQKEPAGSVFEQDEDHPLRPKSRMIETGFLFTVEPGLYFIEMLLKPHREGEFKEIFNWTLIDRLLPCGGIRVEDNIYVGEKGVRNITRQYVPL